MNIDVLLLNAIVYVLTLLFAWIRLKKFNLFILLWIAYSIVAVAGYYCVINDLHYSHDERLGCRVDIVPYIFAYLTNLLITSPFYRLDVKKIRISHITKMNFFKQFAGLMNIVFTIKLITSVLVLIVVVTTIGMGNAYYMIHEGKSILARYPRLDKISWLIGLIIPVFKPVYVIYYMQRLIEKKGSMSLNLYFFAIAFLPNFITDIAMGSKGGLFFSVFEMLFYYVLFRTAIPTNINKVILRIGSVLGMVLIINVFMISISRIDADVNNSDETGTEHVIRYIGEAFPNLGWEFYGKVKTNPNGARFFPEFFDEQKYSSQDDKFDYWTPKTGVSMALFKTFWGDWYVEFGLWGSFIAIFILYILSKKLIFNQYWKLSKIPLVAFYFLYITIYGCFVGSGIEGVGRHRTFLLLLIFGWFINRIEEKTKYALKPQQ